MTIKKGWILWCDATENSGAQCKERLYGYYMSLSEVIEKARDAEWQVVITRGIKYCYCPLHKSEANEIKRR